MSKSAFLKYDPSEHAEQYGWLWTEDDGDEPNWHMIFTIEDDSDLRVYFVARDQTEDADLYVGQPFVLISKPPEAGNAAPGFVLTLDDYRGERLVFSWEADGCGNDQFAAMIRNAVENAITGERTLP